MFVLIEKKTQSVSDLEDLLKCYNITKQEIKSKIITVNGYGDIDETINNIINEIGVISEKETIK